MKKQKLFFYVFLIVISVIFTSCDPTPTPLPIPTYTPTISMASPMSVPAGSVAILVLDDFVDEVDDKAELDYTKIDTTDIIPRNNCVYTIAGQAGVGSRGASPASASDDLPAPHGYLVFEELRSVISRTLTLNTIPLETNGSIEFGVNWIKTIVYFENFQDSKTLALVGVDTSNYTTLDVRTNLQQAIFILSDRGFSSFVINMSFVIMPCPDLENPENLQTTYDQYREIVKNDSSLKDLESDLVSLQANGSFVSDTALRLAFNPNFGLLRLSSYYNSPIYNKQYYSHVLSDPLRTYMDEKLAKSYNVILVGAAGNLKLPYALAPSMWNSVLSVGDLKYSSNFETRKFNSAEVLSEGCTRYEAGGASSYIPGTSFAAPKVSYLAAIYLLDGAKTCTVSDTSFGNITPVLGYAHEDDGNWQNITIGEAANRFCIEFSTPMPGFEPSCP